MATPAANPLISDRDVNFLLYEVLGVNTLCSLPAFAEHSRETFDMLLQATRRFARSRLFPSYRAIDEAPPVLADGAVHVAPAVKELYAGIVDLGLLTASRPESVGGQNLPMSVFTVATTYLMAANLSAYGYVGLTLGAAHLIEAFGDDVLRRTFMAPMYDGRWTGTMALTEPQAGSSLADIATTATPTDGGHYLIRGNKIFISGGEHDLADNIVHLTLARLEGAPLGSRGISLFAVPKRRPSGGGLVDNDVHAAGLIHKIGWRGLPSMVMSYGDNGDCHGWLVGEANRGLHHMFQMMNEARIMVGANGVSTASVAYHESLDYARTRPQGRPLSCKDPAMPPVAIIEHADVRRMLLRQKAIVEGGLSTVVTTAMYADLAAHAATESERGRAQLLLDLLTPIAKSFPAEKGFEANALALQIHGGYGYSSEYLPEAWLRDQKLNSIHEGTTGIQSLDLLGRKVLGSGGAALAALGEEVGAAIAEARAAHVDSTWCDALAAALAEVADATRTLGAVGEAEAMLRHSADYLDMIATVVVAWQWLRRATAAQAGPRRDGADGDFYSGQLAAAQYWFATEVPRISMLAGRCRNNDDAYARMRADWF